MRLFSLLTFAVVTLACTLPASGGLIISEIMYKPSGANNTTPSDEWFELFNSGPSTVDLTTIKFAHSTDASSGVTLNNGVQIISQTPTTTTAGTGLNPGSYAIVGNKSLSAWQTVFGNLPVNTTYVQLNTWTNFADGGENIALYSTISATNIFSINYTHPQKNGVSVQFVGTDTSLAQPFSFSAGRWQDATTSGGGTSGDKHSAGTGGYTFTSAPSGPTGPSTAPEPASVALLLVAGTGVAAFVRRKCFP